MTQPEIQRVVLPEELVQSVSAEDQMLWERLGEAFLPLTVDRATFRAPNVRIALDIAYDQPHATARQLRGIAPEDQTIRQRAMATALEARRAYLHRRIPAFDELAQRLDQDSNYRQRCNVLHADPDLWGIHRRRIEVCKLAHIVEMSTGLPVPAPGAYTMTNGLDYAAY